MKTVHARTCLLFRACGEVCAASLSAAAATAAAVGAVRGQPGGGCPGTWNERPSFYFT